MGSLDPAKRCSKCSEVKPLDEFYRNRSTGDGRNSQCKDCILAYAREHRAENTARRRQWTEANRDRQREYWRSRSTARAAYYQALRDEVLARYGTSCACCGSTEDLTIDHINGDGKSHREALFGQGKGKSSSARRFYQWLRANGFPDGYSVLCRACNASKRTGECCNLDHTRRLVTIPVGVICGNNIPLASVRRWPH